MENTEWKNWESTESIQDYMKGTLGNKTGNVFGKDLTVTLEDWA